MCIQEIIRRSITDAPGTLRNDDIVQSRVYRLREDEVTGVANVPAVVRVMILFFFLILRDDAGIL